MSDPQNPMLKILFENQERLRQTMTREGTAMPGGILPVANGGTGANLSATGGANQIARQNSVGGAFTVSALANADMPVQPIRNGNAFPGSPASNDLFYRSDLDFLCYYDGTRWLTAHEYSVTYPPWNYLVGLGTNATATAGIIPLHTDYTMYFTRCTLKCYSTIAGTGALYHRVWFDIDNAAYSSIYGVTLQTIAANVWTDYSGAPASNVVSGIYSQLRIEKVGAATGTVYLAGAVRYRLIVT